MSETKLVFSLWWRGQPVKNELDGLLSLFSANTGASVDYSFYSQPWHDITTTMLQGIGPSVSEIGSTWTKSLSVTQALNPVPARVIGLLGGKSAFVYTTDPSAEETNYSVPLFVETRVIYYRKDLLAKAGVDEAIAFSTPRKVIETLEALRQSGIEYPLLFPMANRWLTLSLAASWVWGAGGDFIAPDGKSVLFDKEESAQGISEFLSLARYTNPELKGVENPDLLYGQGGHAITMGSPWLYHYITTSGEANPILRETIDVALPPGPSYLGGTNLVVWKHSRNLQLAFNLVSFLAGPDVQMGWRSGILPARRDALLSDFYNSNPAYKKMVQATLAGRAFSSQPLWGVVEQRLSSLLSQLWDDCAQKPKVSLTDIIESDLSVLARRLAITLAG